MQPSEYGKGRKDSSNLDLLRELDELQARDPLPGIEPPALVDQAVRNLARRELHNHASTPIAGKLRWIAGLSTVSIALLAIGISMVQTRQDPAPQMQSPQLQAPQQGRSMEPALKNEFKDEMLQSRPAPEAASSASVAPEARTSSRARREDSMSGKQAATATEMVTSDAAEDPAQAWLDLVEQLYDQGLRKEARKQLDALVAAYPDHELPGWALRLLEQEK